MQQLRVLLISISACYLLLATSVEGWGCPGHMLVAEIARRHLTANVTAAVDTIVHSFSSHGPFPMASDMVQAACWLDDLRGYRMYGFNDWHFVDKPFYYYGELEQGHGLPVVGEDPSNIRVHLRDAVRGLQKSHSAPRFVLEFSLFQLLHLMGDIHQPLHCTTLVSPAFPSGDRGGNEIIVRSDGVKIPLHRLWDNVCDVHFPHLARPLNQPDRERLHSWADRLVSRYGNRVAPLVQNFTFSPTLFASESYDFAVNTSYKDGTAAYHPGAAPVILTEKYMRRCRSVARQRIVLGGLRLAKVLNQVFEGGIPPVYGEGDLGDEIHDDPFNGDGLLAK